MIIYRSVIDGFNILLGSSFTNIALVITYLTYWAENGFTAVLFMEESDYWVEIDEVTYRFEWYIFGMHLLLAFFKLHQVFNTVNHFLTPILTVALISFTIPLIVRRVF